MRRALALARRGAGRVSPNPMVGAVLVRQGRVVGEGYHRRFGAPHAEVEALVEAGSRARGSVLFTTLEPCAHQGKTPPCVEAIRDAGVRRVWVAIRDPHPFVGGRGIRRLRNAGVRVETGLMEPEARELNEAYLTRLRQGRPLVTLKLATSLDGRLGAPGGSRWLTSDRARALVHRWRRQSDAVLVGRGTVGADDPRLTARGDGRGGPRQPLRVVLDSHFRTSPGSRLLRTRRGGPVIIYGIPGQAGRRQRLMRAGAEVVEVPARGGRTDPLAALRDLASRGVSSVLVEGGGQVAAALLRAGLVDRVHWFVAPIVLGEQGLPAVADAGHQLPAGRLRLRVVRVVRLGPDTLIVGRPVRAPG